MRFGDRGRPLRFVMVLLKEEERFRPELVYIWGTHLLVKAVRNMRDEEGKGERCWE